MRQKLLNGVLVDLTTAEEVQRDAEEAAWAARYIPTNDEIDQDELNRALAQNGSVLRALAELTLIEINKLRADHARAPYTKTQFVAALKAQMRT